MKLNNLSVLIRDRVKKYGERDALRYKDTKNEVWKSVSWNSFGEQIDLIAKALLTSGVKVQDNIAIFSQNMPEWTISDFAILSVRATVIPLYATSTVVQAKYITNETASKIMFVGEQEQYEVALEVLKTSEYLEKIILFDSNIELKDSRSIYFKDFLIEGKTASNQEELNERLAKISSEDLVTIIYTSGTTGEPKGVMLQQKNFMNTFKIHDIKMNVNDKDISLAFLPLAHIFERAWTYFALYKGMTNVYLRDPKEIISRISEIKPTVMCAVPRFYEKIYAAVFSKLESSSPVKKKLFLWAVKIGKQVVEKKRLSENIPFIMKVKHAIGDKLVLKKIRSLVGGNIKIFPCAGAPLAREINEFFHSAGIFIQYGYGLTETLATVTVFDYTGFDFKTVGSPMPGVELKIGKNQEVLLKGASITKGYYKKPEITKNSFIDGWFKTGDAGLIDEKGNLIITDRIKDLVITSGGKNIAPQRIELVFGNEILIDQIAIIGDTKKYISALIVPSFTELENFAKAKAIDYKNREDLVTHPTVISLYKNKIKTLQGKMAEYEKIKKFRLLTKSFSIKQNEITPTMKVKRKVIMEHYKEIIDEMYK